MNKQEYQKAWRAAHAEELRAYMKVYRQANREKLKKLDAELYQKNKDKYDAANQKWVEVNRERRREIVAKSDRKNQYRRNETQRRRAAQIRATVSNKEAILEIYKNCPAGYVVDHIIPLRHEKVCGLHTPANLQYLTRRENAVKHNSFDGTPNNTAWKERV